MKSLLLMLRLTVFLFPVVVFAEVVRIPDDALTIGDAYLSCADGDTLLLAAGVYQESLTLGDKDLTIASSYLFDPDSVYIQSTILLPDPDARLFTFENTTRIAVTFMGLSFQEANLTDSSRDDNGGIVYGENLDLTIKHCTFNKNYAPYGSCLFLIDSECTMCCTTFIENSCSVFGGAVTFYNVKVDMKYVRFAGNLSNYYAGALVLSQCSGIVRDNVFLGNYALTGAGAIYAGTKEGSVESLRIEHNAFVENVALMGGALYTLGIDTLTVTDNLFRHNMAALDESQFPMGGAIYIGPESEVVDIWGNEFHHNFALNKGGVAVFASDVEFHDNLLFRNRGNVHYALATQYANSNQGMHAKVYRNLFFQNSEYTPGFHDSFGAITACNEGLLTASENDFYGNTPIAAGLHPDAKGQLAVANNFWGDASGPYHETQNPDGTGDAVMPGVDVEPFATQPFTSRWLHAPEPFALCLPQNGSFLADSSVTFRWRAAKDATPIDTLRYSLELSPDPDFSYSRVIDVDTDTLIVVADLEWETVCFWRVVARDIFDLSITSSDVHVLMLTEAALVSEDITPTGLKINQLYPNPCEGLVRIAATIPQPGQVIVEVVNLHGDVVSTLQNGLLAAGQHSFTWQPDVCAGVYVVVLRTGTERATRKLVHVKRESATSS